MASCLCESRGYVRALEEDDFGFPDKIASLAETPDALLGSTAHEGSSDPRGPLCSRRPVPVRGEAPWCTVFLGSEADEIGNVHRVHPCSNGEPRSPAVRTYGCPSFRSRCHAK
jgi:hypothetical protein